MSPLLDTVFVLGAGFSVEQGFPLAQDIRQDVISFLNSERNPQQGFLRPGNGGYPEGQFYAGLGMIEEDGELPFEELLIKLAERLKQGDAGPCRQTDEQLRIGARRALWEIHNSIEQVEPAYKNFAAWLRADWHRHGIISFNWDLQAEQMLHQGNVPWHYCLTAIGRLPVIKPHGSINWSRYRQENLISHYGSWQPVSSTKLSFVAQKPLSDARLDDATPYLNYMLYPGDPDRPETHEDIKLLWQDAARLIDRAEQVVFIGYSFPYYDDYSRHFFQDNMRGKHIIVVNPSKCDLQRFKCVLGAAAAEMELREEAFGDCQFAQPATDA